MTKEELEKAKHMYWEYEACNDVINHLKDNKTITGISMKFGIDDQIVYLPYTVCDKIATLIREECKSAKKDFENLHV